MALFSFLQPQSKEPNKFLTISINSRDIRCLAFYPSEEAFKIIGYGIQDIEKGAVRNGFIIDKNMLIEATKSVISQAFEQLEDTTDSLVIGSGGNTSFGLMTTIRYKRGKRGHIEKAELTKLYEKVTETAYIQAQEVYSESTGNLETELANITSADILLKVDGQAVNSFDGKEGSVLEAAVFNAFAPAYHVKMLQEIAKKSGLTILAVGTHNYAIVQWIKETYPDSLDFILINIDEDTTNVAVVFAGGIAATKNLDIGFKHFVDGISDRMGLTQKESEKILKSYLGELLTESEASVVQNCLLDILSTWIKGLEILFTEFNVKVFPSQIYVTGTGSEVKDLIQTMKNEPWTKTVAFKSLPDITRFSLSDISGVIDSTGKVSGAEWMDCLSLSVIYKELYKEDGK